jgi:hypothetical protein
MTATPYRGLLAIRSSSKINSEHLSTSCLAVGYGGEQTDDRAVVDMGELTVTLDVLEIGARQPQIRHRRGEHRGDRWESLASSTPPTAEVGTRRDDQVLGRSQGHHRAHQKSQTPCPCDPLKVVKNLLRDWLAAWVRVRDWGLHGR